MPSKKAMLSRILEINEEKVNALYKLNPVIAEYLNIIG